MFTLHKDNIKHDLPIFTEARDFIRGFKQAPKAIRSPFLAEIELEARLIEVCSSHGCISLIQKQAGQSADVAMELIFAYFEKFGLKSCCVYLSILFILFGLLFYF